MTFVLASTAVVASLAAHRARTSRAAVPAQVPILGPKGRHVVLESCCGLRPALGCARRNAVRAAAAAADKIDVPALAAKFNQGKEVQVMEGTGGLPMVRLTHACGASADVYLFGGTVISWKQANGSEVLYVRPDAKFDKSKPISGGIPHCFPQFGPGAIQQHGFARNIDWTIGSTSADPQVSGNNTCCVVE